MSAMNPNIAVLAGGWSSEREISLESGRAVFDSLQRQGYRCELLDATPDLLLQLSDRDITHVFNLLHGTGGEDGIAQAAIELQGLQQTGSGLAASAVGMDKMLTKAIWRANSLPTANALLVLNRADAERVESEVGFPCFVKPVSGGSSICTSRVESPEALLAVLDSDQASMGLMAEALLSGDEYTAAVLGDRVLPLIRIEPKAAFYDYQAKYVDDSTEFHIPCGLSDEEETQYSAMALKAFQVLGCTGWGRVDFMLDAHGKPQLLEVNTIPGMTSHSLVPMAAKAVGMDFDALVAAILSFSRESAVPRRRAA